MEEGRKLAAIADERRGQGAAHLGRAEGLPHASPTTGARSTSRSASRANQALLAAKAGATFISPFIGRLDDIGIDGMELIEEIRAIYDNYDARRRRSSPPRSARRTT